MLNLKINPSKNSIMIGPANANAPKEKNPNVNKAAVAFFKALLLCATSTLFKKINSL